MSVANQIFRLRGRPDGTGSEPAGTPGGRRYHPTPKCDGLAGVGNSL